MLCAGVVLPHPPLLIPGVAGAAAAELDGLREACRAALAEGLAAAPDCVVMLGTGTADGPASGAPSLAPYGLPGPPDAWPLPLTVGSWLLDQARWEGPRRALSVSADATPAACAVMAGALAAAEGRTLLVVLGDGSACRSAAAPGHLDPRAEAFDTAVASALSTGDVFALSDVDPLLAADLMVAGRAPWQVLAGAFGRTTVAARMHYAAAPYGVGYFVACWRPAP